MRADFKPRSVGRFGASARSGCAVVAKWWLVDLGIEFVLKEQAGPASVRKPREIK